MELKASLFHLLLRGAIFPYARKRQGHPATFLHCGRLPFRHGSWDLYNEGFSRHTLMLLDWRILVKGEPNTDAEDDVYIRQIFRQPAFKIQGI